MNKMINSRGVGSWAWWRNHNDTWKNNTVLEILSDNLNPELIGFSQEHLFYCFPRCIAHVSHILFLYSSTFNVKQLLWRFIHGEKLWLTYPKLDDSSPEREGRWQGAEANRQVKQANKPMMCKWFCNNNNNERAESGKNTV